jgi:hypothetical protein
MGGQVNGWIGRLMDFFMDAQMYNVLIDEWVEELRCVIGGCAGHSGRAV